MRSAGRGSGVWRRACRGCGAQPRVSGQSAGSAHQLWPCDVGSGSGVQRKAQGGWGEQEGGRVVCSNRAWHEERPQCRKLSLAV